MDCGMETFNDDAIKDQILAETGLRPSFALEAFPKAEDDAKHTAARIEANPLIPRKNIRGFLYEVETGRLREVGLD
jgi:carbonic anhydrase